jgi:LL-diaminopimelate aminotransferase
MITENLISTVPWDDVGTYVRFSVTFAATDLDDEARVVAEIGQRLGRFTFQW